MKTWIDLRNPQNAIQQLENALRGPTQAIAFTTNSVTEAGHAHMNALSDYMFTWFASLPQSPQSMQQHTHIMQTGFHTDNQHTPNYLPSHLLAVEHHTATTAAYLTGCLSRCRSIMTLQFTDVLLIVFKHRGKVYIGGFPHMFLHPC